jgi:hypothetical protein
LPLQISNADDQNNVYAVDKPVNQFLNSEKTAEPAPEKKTPVARFTLIEVLPIANSSLRTRALNVQFTSDEPNSDPNEPGRDGNISGSGG